MLAVEFLKTERNNQISVGLRVILSIVIVAFVAAHAILAQGQKAVLVDEFGSTPCDELKARTRNFAQRVAEEQSSRGLVIIYPKKGLLPNADYRRKFILSQFAFSEMEDRVEFIQGPERNEIETELWKIPAGVKNPEFLGTRWVDPPLKLSKPFIFDYADENGECPTFVPRKFAELINANPGSRAHIVVGGGDRNSMRLSDFASEWVTTLTKEVKIPRSRIRIFYGKRDSRTLTYAEFWFVPGPKR